jgi:hypothetical protein
LPIGVDEFTGFDGHKMFGPVDVPVLFEGHEHRNGRAEQGLVRDVTVESLERSVTLNLIAEVGDIRHPARDDRVVVDYRLDR